MDTENNMVTQETSGYQGGETTDETASVATKAQVQRIIQKIKADKRHHEKAFKRMRADMQLATWGREKTWSEDKYVANITGRHIRAKTNALYAKNPKAVAKRRDTLDFRIWDETQESLLLAMQTIQMAQQMQMQAPTIVDPVTGQQVPDPSYAQLPPGFEQAQATIADYQEGTRRRQQMKAFGRTLEVLFARALQEQKPLDFKTAMKKVVRRACTTGVGYVRLGFQREMGPPVSADARIADFRERITHLQGLLAQLQEGEIDTYSPEIAELEASLQAIQNEQIVLREGLVFDFPQSTKVIPDSNCKSLVGFVGSDVLTLEHTSYTVQDIKDIFGVDLGDCYTAYTYDKNGSRGIDDEGVQGDLFADKERKKDSFVCVWEHFDQRSGLVYWLADGYHGWLREPAAPDVTVSDFWPIYALTFNDVESEDELFPPSDVTLIRGMQREVNLSRQGKREHRDAARPRWVHPKGALDDEDNMAIANMGPFENLGINIGPGSKILDILQPIPVPGVDPNLYDTNEVWADLQTTVGSQQARLGGLSKASATETAISASSSAASDGADIDDLDGFLSIIARAGSQILMREMTEEQVLKICGPGAVWPVQDAEQIADELYLEVAAGSTGKPNQAVEINNWNKMLPFLLQMGSIQPEWLARETLRRLDDTMDLTEAVTAGIPSIVAQNAMANKAAAPQPATGDARTDPSQQGAQGANNAQAAPGGPPGTDAAFGSNQV